MILDNNIKAENKFKHILEKFREEIINDWIHRLHTQVSERYSKLPIKVSEHNMPEAIDAYYEMIINNNFSKIDQFIQRIAQERLEEGFPLSDVQKAFELYRKILTPIIVKEIEYPYLLFCLEKLNFSLIYIITKFSNYFQTLHERGIRNYAEDLEREVRKRTKQLAESEANYRALVEDINDGYFVNKDGKIVFANKTFSEMHGYSSPDEVVGRPYTAFLAPTSIKMVSRFYKKRIRGEKTKDHYMFLRKHKDGQYLPTENVVNLIFYQGETVVAGICRDITERIEMEKRIRDSERLAHIGQLTTSIAHEIRNPLSSVKMNAQILLKNIGWHNNCSYKPLTKVVTFGLCGAVISYFLFKTNYITQFFNILKNFSIKLLLLLSRKTTYFLDFFNLFFFNFTSIGVKRNAN